jgi:hypothetical protein
MKTNSINYIAQKMMASPVFKNISEQTIYTIVFDALKL